VPQVVQSESQDSHGAAHLSELFVRRHVSVTRPLTHEAGLATSQLERLHRPRV
jgi:hypothetical protein